MSPLLPFLALDPVVWVLLAVFIGLPLLSFVVMGLFAASADFRFVEVRVRGGRLRGVIASALARVIVRDADTIQVPLLVVLEKTGVMGASTPLFGGAKVRDIECKVFLDGEHVSTVTEARTAHIESFQRRVELPVNVELHLPKGVIRAYRDYRAKKRRAAEIELSVRGHVTVRHWFIHRQVPVRVKRHVVVGDPVPRLEQVRWRAVDGDAHVWTRAEVRFSLTNPYRDEELEGPVRVELRRRRRMLPDVLLAVHEEMKVELKPKGSREFVFRTRVVPSDGSAGTQSGSPPVLPSQVDEPSVSLKGGGDEAAKTIDEGDEEEGEQGLAVALRVFFEDNELTPEEVRVLGVPGAKTGPVLSLSSGGREMRKKNAGARLEPVRS